MDAFTLAVRSLTSVVYFWFSFSRRVRFALTMAIDSFIRGTWSFRSRMFCSRISSGFSMPETKKPKKLRIARLKRFHMGQITLVRWRLTIRAEEEVHCDGPVIPGGKPRGAARRGGARSCGPAASANEPGRPQRRARRAPDGSLHTGESAPRRR